MGLLDKARERLRQQQGAMLPPPPPVASAATHPPPPRPPDYRAVLSTLRWLDADDEALGELTALRADARLKPKEDAKLAKETFLRCAEEALNDDLLTANEEHRLLALGEALGLTSLDGADYTELNGRLVVAKVNDGRLPVIEVPIILKPGERGHASASAALLKEVALKEFRAGSHGVSFRIAKGVTYRTGRTRGQMVTVGSKVVTEDIGTLYLTSARAIFRGDRRLLEFDYRKLVDVRVFSDGLGLAVSNRQTPSTFRVASNADALAAIVNAAAQKVL